MRIISFNANGLRAAARKGLFSWFSRQPAQLEDKALRSRGLSELAN